MDENEQLNENQEEEENEEQDRLSYTPIDYDPNSSDRIICIELENNQQIFVEYKPDWNIHNLISELLSRKEFKLLYQNRNFILSSIYHPDIFDLSLSFYDTIIPNHENRVADYISLEKLHELHILKNYRTPLFILKSNSMTDDYIYSNNYKLDQLKEIKDSKFNYYAAYFDYMPKMIKWNSNLLLAHPELEEYFIRNKRGLNEFTPFKRNILTCDKKTIDWFIYDKESIKFLLEMQQLEFVENSNLKYINGKIYLEDKYDTTSLNNDKNSGKIRKASFNKGLTDKDLANLYVDLKVDLSNDIKQNNVQTHKFKITSNTTAFNLIEKLSVKLHNSTKDSKFEPKKKILKVLSQNDYIFEINEPLINFQYIIDCVKLNKIATYIVIDNPALIEQTNQQNSSGNKNSNNNNLNISLDSSNSGDLNLSVLGSFQKAIQGGKYDLRNIAVYNPTLNNYTNDIMNPLTVLEKAVNTSANNNNNNINAQNHQGYNPRIRKNNVYIGRRSNQKLNFNEIDLNDINALTNLLNFELQNEVEEQLKNGDLMVNKQKANQSEQTQKNQEEHKNKRKSQVLRLNDDDSLYLKKRKKYKNLAMNKKEPNMFLEPSNTNNIETKISPNVNHDKRSHKSKKLSLSSQNNINDIYFKQPKPLINKQEIPISEINRPFSILLRSANIIPLLNSNEFESKMVTTVLLFKFELFCSNVSICPPKQIRWKTVTKVQNPIFNKRIYFDINYSRLPVKTSLITKIKFIQYNKSKEVYKNDTIFWSNYSLFDQNNRLKVGLHKINLHDREVSDDIYYSFNDNPNDKTASKIYFEIESFSKPVVNKIIKKDKKDKDWGPNIFPVEEDFVIKANKINQKSPFDDLNNYEKETLWRNRFAAAKINSLIAKLFLSCDNNNPNVNDDLEKIISKISKLSIVQAIELLSGKYVNSIIRNFAVDCLRKFDPIIIQVYLLQLVQALKYEKNIDNALARFLIEKSIEHPITIGHEFFWHMRSEMSNQDVQQRFGLYLEVFLSKISRQLFKIFRDEDNLLKSLVGIAEKIKTIKNVEDRDRIFREDINNIDGYLKLRKKEVSLPLNFKMRTKGIIADKCRIMKSKKKPLWLTFENADPLGSPIVVMLKCGDDLRMDMVTLQLFKAMQTLWSENGLNLKMSLYKVLCTGNQEGMLEMVTNAETLANIHVQEGGALSQFFSKGSIKNWIDKNCSSKIEAIDNFLLSNVAYCLATFVLGIGDRHNDNIMIKKNGELFHIDFGHFLGHFKYKMGIKRERAPFVFTRQFQSVLGGDSSEKFAEFKSKLEKGYLILRNNKEVIITLLNILLCTGIPELNEKSMKYLEKSLFLKNNDKEAIEFLDKKLNESMDSVSTKLNFAIHIIANK